MVKAASSLEITGLMMLIINKVAAAMAKPKIKVDDFEEFLKTLNLSKYSPHSEEEEGEENKPRMIMGEGVGFDVFDTRTHTPDLFEEEMVAAVVYRIQKKIRDPGPDGFFRLVKIPSNIFSEVIDYCKKHAEAEKEISKGTSPDVFIRCQVKDWDDSFIEYNMRDLGHLFQAAMLLEVKGLVSLIVTTVTSMAKSFRMTVEENVDMVFCSKKKEKEEEKEVRSQRRKVLKTGWGDISQNAV